MFLHFFLSGLLYRFTTTDVSTFLFYPDYCIDSQQLMFLHYFLSGSLYRFTTTYVSTFLFIRITVSIHNNLCFYISFYQDYCIDSQQLMFLHFFLSGLLYRFTTTYVSTFLFIRITVSIHNNLCFYITFHPDYCIDSQQFMFLHYFLSGLLYRFTTIYVSTLLFIGITVSIHNNLCFYISFYQDYCIDSQQLMFLHYFLSGLLYRFTTIYVYTLLFIRITVSIHNNLCFYINFLSGLLYRFTTTYVSSLLFIRITVSIHNNFCFYITFHPDYCIDSQQFMFLHYFLSGLLYRFTTTYVSTLLFIRITVSIHCIDSQQFMFLHYFLSGLMYQILLATEGNSWPSNYSVKCAESNSWPLNYSVECAEGNSWLLNYSVKCGEGNSWLLNYSVECAEGNSWLLNYSVKCGEGNSWLLNYSVKCAEGNSWLLNYSVECAEGNSWLLNYSLKCTECYSWLSMYSVKGIEINYGCQITPSNIQKETLGCQMYRGQLLAVKLLL
jgi:hypothetical protein